MAAPGNMITEVIASRELLFALAYRDIRVKYKQAVMGILWAFFLPVLGIAAGVMVQVGIAFVRGETLQMTNVVSVMVRTLPWMLFIQILGGTANGLLGGMGLASKIYFPRQIIPLSTVLSVLFDFAIMATVVVVLLTVLPNSPLILSWQLLLVPVFVLTLILMALGLGLIFGSANIFFRDVKYILQVLLQFGVFFTPVYLFVDQLGKLGQIMLWNPVAPILEAIAQIALRGGVDVTLWPMVGYSFAFAFTALCLGSFVFRRSEHLFAEVM